MDIETLRAYCLGKPGTTEGFPFDEVTLVIKVMNKIFAFISLDSSPTEIALKCEPERAIELRDQHAEIVPGFHLNKSHWNTINIEGSLPNSLIFELADLSYSLVVKGLKKSEKEALKDL